MHQALIGSCWLQDASQQKKDMVQSRRFEKMLRSIKNWPGGGFNIPLDKIPKQVVTPAQAFCARGEADEQLVPR